MILLHTGLGSIRRRTILYIFLSFAWSVSKGQDTQGVATAALHQIYKATQEALSEDPIIQNGVYYTYPYYNAIGHPFLDQKEFESGFVVFREKSYDDLILNYDLFNQQLILSREHDGVLQMNLLAKQFVSEFYLKGRQFVRAEFFGSGPAIFQAVAETGSVSCYYSWYKERREVRDSGNRSIFSFSDQKSRRYLLLDGQLTRYKNNKSFVKIFPDESRTLIREYLQKNKLLVLEASDKDVKSLILYADRILNQELNRGGK